MDNFHRILLEKLKASAEVLHDEIAEIIEDEFDTAIAKKIFPFKENIHAKMIHENCRRYSWACMKLEEINKTFAGSLQNEAIISIIKDAHLQAKEIFSKYNSEIEKTYQNCNIELHCKCFRRK